MTALLPETKLAEGTRIERGLSFEAYCAAPGLNASLAKWLLVSPAHYQAALTTEREESIDMRMGQIVHKWVLEGRLPEYVIRPDFRPLGGGLFDMSEPWHGSKRWCKDWKAAQTLPVMTQEDATRECRICDAIADDPLACAALANCPEREVSVFAEWHGIPIKARFDSANFERGLLADLKTARDGSPAGFGRAVHEYRYLLSAAWYCRIFELATGRWPQWAWIVAETSPAACVTVYRPTEEQMKLGVDQMERALSVFAECQASKSWPGYSRGEERFLELPAWAMREAESLRLKP